MNSGPVLSPDDQVAVLTADAELNALRLLVEATSHSLGAEFFPTLVQHLAQAIDVQYSLVAEFCDSQTKVRTLALWSKNELSPNLEYELEGTPCNDVVHGGYCEHPNHVAALFPRDKILQDLGICSYMGVPLLDNENNVLGHLAVFDQRPMAEDPRRTYIFKVFAARAAAELVRLRLDKKIGESEQRYRDLFEQAPIPYVYEDTDTKFISVNDAAMKLLGLKPEDVTVTYGMSLVAQTQANLEQLNKAFEDIRMGRERGLVELELHRKDNGQPIWVQFWSRPEPDGKHTRTMIIDITQRVLAEREQARLTTQNAYLQEEIKATLHFDEIVGRSPSLNAVMEHVRAVAPTDATVLITGETGTGKELVARAIHSSSRRKDKPLIKVNCAALPAGLVESELFGHEKGAFTGAIARRVGRFELAEGGTIFLDEIGDLPIEMQAKLLRVLQEHELERIGGGAPVKIDVRVIAATNRDLVKAVADKTFREDLYYRLNVFPLRLPSLRERKGDIPLLANYFTHTFSRQFGKPLQGVDAKTLELMSEYPWPGNIRELQNIVERAAILSPGPLLTVAADILQAPEVFSDAATSDEDPCADHSPSPGESASAPGTLGQIERDHIVAVLQQTGWRIDGPRGAAKILGINPNTLRSRMKKMGIERP